MSGPDGVIAALRPAEHVVHTWDIAVALDPTATGYGRLDADHTPALTVTGVDLDDPRRAFPGF
jgi:hypothetical protein